MKTNTNQESRCRYIQNPDVIVKEEDSEGALVFNPDTDKIMVLNPTGYFVWRQCNGRNSMPELVAAIREGFADVPEERVAGEVQGFLEKMIAEGFIGILDEAEEES